MNAPSSELRRDLAVVMCDLDVGRLKENLALYYFQKWRVSQSGEERESLFQRLRALDDLMTELKALSNEAPPHGEFSKSEHQRHPSDLAL